MAISRKLGEVVKAQGERISIIKEDLMTQDNYLKYVEERLQAVEQRLDAIDFVFRESSSVTFNGGTVKPTGKTTGKKLVKSELLRAENLTDCGSPKDWKENTQTINFQEKLDSIATYVESYAYYLRCYSGDVDGRDAQDHLCVFAEWVKNGAVGDFNLFRDLMVEREIEERRYRPQEGNTLEIKSFGGEEFPLMPVDSEEEVQSVADLQETQSQPQVRVPLPDHIKIESNKVDNRLKLVFGNNRGLYAVDGEFFVTRGVSGSLSRLIPCDLVRVDRLPTKVGVMWTSATPENPQDYEDYDMGITLNENMLVILGKHLRDGDNSCSAIGVTPVWTYEFERDEVWVVVPRGETVEEFYGEDW